MTTPTQTVVKLRVGGVLTAGKDYAVYDGQPAKGAPIYRMTFMGKFWREQACWNNGAGGCIEVSRLGFATHHTVSRSRGDKEEWMPFEISSSTRIWGDWSAYHAEHIAPQEKKRAEAQKLVDALRKRAEQALKAVSLPLTKTRTDFQGRPFTESMVQLSGPIQTYDRKLGRVTGEWEVPSPSEVTVTLTLPQLESLARRGTR